MRGMLPWLLASLVGLAAGTRNAPAPPMPDLPPPLPATANVFDRTIRLHVMYDEAFSARHGDGLEAFVREAVAIHNIEWQRYRREWFRLERLALRPSGEERDASHVLATFLHGTVERPDTIHVYVVGRPLEVYTSGTGAVDIGGLAYRGLDTVLVVSTPGVTPDLLAYYLFHEIGHCWDAFDLPFHGGDTTFGSKKRMTFDVDAGNEQIMEDAPGPLPRRTPGRAAMAIRGKLARARATAGATDAYPLLHDLLLHEPSPSNPAYVAKRSALLAAAGPASERIARVIERYEVTRQRLRDDAEARQRMSEHYWRANDAIRRGDYDAADLELEAIGALSTRSGDVHMLANAVSRKVRRMR